MIYIWIYHKMISTIRIANIFFTSHSWIFCVWWELQNSILLATFKYTLKNLTIVTRLYIISPELIDLIIGSLYSSTTINHFSGNLPPTNLFSVFISLFCLFVWFFVFMFFCVVFYFYVPHMNKITQNLSMSELFYLP